MSYETYSSIMRHEAALLQTSSPSTLLMLNAQWEIHNQMIQTKSSFTVLIIIWCIKDNLTVEDSGTKTELQNKQMLIEDHYRTVERMKGLFYAQNHNVIQMAKSPKRRTCNYTEACFEHLNQM